MKELLFIPVFALLAMTGCQQEKSTLPETGTARLTLNLQAQQQTTVTRAVDENALADANLYIYREHENELFAHYYTTDPYFIIDIEPAIYTFYVVGNAHRDMGNPTRRELVDCKDFGTENDGTLLMTTETTETIRSSTHLLKLKLYRKAARIAYNVTVAQPALEAGIRIRSVQLCNAPDTAPLYGKAENTPTDAGYHASEECPAKEGGATAMGTFYMLPNEQGMVPGITEQSQKNRQNAPANATYLRIRCEKRGATLEYLVYLGANNTDDFNVHANEAHTYDVTIWSDDRADTRITRYLLECEDRWPEGKYRSVSDKGVLAYTVENTTDHELAGRLTVVQGDADALTVTAGGAGHRTPYEFAGEGSGRLELTYAPLLIREGKNSRLEYRAEVVDETGQSVAYDFAHEFANKVEIFASEGTDIEAVKVTGALDQARTPEKAVAWCYEGGLDLETTAERFDGWYADADFTRKLSAEKMFRYIPTEAESRVYAKFKMPETVIQCHEEVKNSTYMNNVNTVDLTVANYTGPVTVKAVCKQGGLFTSGAQQTVQVEAGKQITLPEKIVFVPLEAGEVSYVIEVYLPDGTKIGATTITNTIAATRLVPTIRVYYANPIFQGKYFFTAGGGYPLTSWYGYTHVCADVSFTPTLDYPAPLENEPMVEVQLSPKATRTITLVLSNPAYRQWELREEEVSSESNPTWSSFIVSYPAAPETAFTEYLSDVSDLSGDSDLFAPHSEYTDRILYPGPWTNEEPDLSEAKLLNRYFIYFSFGNRIESSDIKIENLYFRSELEIVTDFRSIHIIDELANYWQE